MKSARKRVDWNVRNVGACEETSVYLFSADARFKKVGERGRRGRG